MGITIGRHGGEAHQQQTATVELILRFIIDSKVLEKI